MGNIKVKNLLTRFEDYQVNKKNGFFIEDGKIIKPSPSEKCFFDVKQYLFDNKKTYVKDTGIACMQELFNEIFLGRVYNASGINSVYAYPLYAIDYTRICEDDSCKYIESIMTEDVESLGVTVVKASDFFKEHRAYMILKFLKDKSEFEQKYATIINSDLKEYLLQYMSAECLDQLNNLFDGATLFGSSDVHDGNYFFYKVDPNSDKFDGVIGIDNENIFATQSVHGFAKNESVKESFYKYLDTPYSMYLPMSSYQLNYLMVNDDTHKNRISNLNNLIANGLLNDGQIDVIRKLVAYDCEKEIKTILNQYPGIKCDNRILDMIKYLNEYNRENLELY